VLLDFRQRIVDYREDALGKANTLANSRTEPSPNRKVRVSSGGTELIGQKNAHGSDRARHIDHLTVLDFRHKPRFAFVRITSARRRNLFCVVGVSFDFLRAEVSVKNVHNLPGHATPQPVISRKKLNAGLTPGWANETLSTVFARPPRALAVTSTLHYKVFSVNQETGRRRPPRGSTLAFRIACPFGQYSLCQHSRNHRFGGGKHGEAPRRPCEDSTGQAAAIGRP
jgi:hypothetical protein